MHLCLTPFTLWYCRDTKCLGDYGEAGGSDLYGEFSEAVKAFDKAFESVISTKLHRVQEIGDFGNMSVLKV